jgi:hypothetical protein
VTKLQRSTQKPQSPLKTNDPSSTVLWHSVRVRGLRVSAFERLDIDWKEAHSQERGDKEMRWTQESLVTARGLVMAVAAVLVVVAWVISRL